LLCAVLLGANLMNAWAQPGSRLQANSDVAVVDFQAVFDASKERKQIQAELETMRQKLQEEGQERKKDLEDLRGDMEFLNPGTEAYRRKQEQLELGLFELKAWEQFNNKKLDREHSIRLQALYRKFADVAGEVARSSGYEAVLLNDDLTFPRGMNRKETTAMIGQRKVVWASDEVDITKLVIDRMNAQWDNRGSSGRSSLPQ
jgi:Skp family chaperone for outer membrane proteins